MKDWDLLIDILAGKSAAGFVAWLANAVGIADRAIERFVALAMQRTTQASLWRAKSAVDCPA